MDILVQAAIPVSLKTPFSAALQTLPYHSECIFYHPPEAPPPPKWPPPPEKPLLEPEEKKSESNVCTCRRLPLEAPSALQNKSCDKKPRRLLREEIFENTANQNRTINNTAAMPNPSAPPAFCVSVASPVQIKIHGAMHALTAPDKRLTPQQAEALLRTAINDQQWKRFQDENELNIGYGLKDVGSFRISLFRQRGTAAAVIRYIPGDIPEFDTLGMPAVLKELILQPRGLFLMVGATGVGKTTTLASLIDYRNAHCTGHILTLEDPIEFVFRNQLSIVNQRQIGSDTRDLHTALKSALRQAPDCILIGEIRDIEAMAAAIAYAQSGHLVLATLHANNAAHALNRILSFYAPENRAALLEVLEKHALDIVAGRVEENWWNVSGFAYGVSGSIFALARWGQEMPTPGRAQHAVKILLQRLNSFRCAEGWRAQLSERSGTGDAHTGGTWCSGSAGIALALAAVHVWMPEFSPRTELDRAVQYAFRTGTRSNLTLCHGDLGTLEVLNWIIARVPDVPGAEDIRAAVKNGYGPSVIRATLDDKSSRYSLTPSLLVGTSGVLSWLAHRLGGGRLYTPVIPDVSEDR